jgi:tetratricopeptide (TPR) repeat protein
MPAGSSPALARAGAALVLGLLPCLAAAREQPLSALPPPVTRSLYRAYWFEFLNAHLEDDAAVAARALSEMTKASQKMGVRRLSDFSRTALHEARRAKQLDQPKRSRRAYEAALLLDDANLDALLSRIAFLARRREYRAAISLLPDLPGALMASRETRLALLSSLLLWSCFALGAAVFAWVLALFLRHRLRVAHDIRELADRLFGERGTTPLALAVLGLPLLLGLGPLWLLIYWAILLHAYGDRRERFLLGAGLVLLGLVAPLLVWVARENVLQRSPLFVAAVDLAEGREDASAEDGLAQASAVFPEDPDVWYLLGLYAERAGDFSRAQRFYGRAVQADPKDFRPFLQMGNLHFQEGDFAQAVLDYDEAARRAPDRPEPHYNLSIVRGESYDFAGQDQAIARARALSSREVNACVEAWNAQPKSRRLPGHAAALNPLRAVLSPLSLAPWGALLAGLALSAYRARRGLASECARCGGAFCVRCKRYGDPPLYCTTCVRLHLLREPADIGDHVAQARQMRRRALWKDRLRRLASLLFPGTDRVLSERPVIGLLLLFVFFFAIAAAVLDRRLFSAWQLAAGGGFGTEEALALGTAFLLWLFVNLSNRRSAHGS